MNHRDARPSHAAPASLRGAGLAALFVALAGCASVVPPQQTEVTYAERGGIDEQHRQVGLQILTVPEGERVMLIKSPDDVERVCSPRESDEGLSVSEGLSLSLPSGGSVGEQVGDEAVALGQPTAIVQLARELLYRACELSLNLDADAATTREIYERFLSTLEVVAPATRDVADEDDDDDDEEDGDDGEDG